jgi:predicted metal-dependent hydrolase
MTISRIFEISRHAIERRMLDPSSRLGGQSSRILSSGFSASTLGLLAIGLSGCNDTRTSTAIIIFSAISFAAASILAGRRFLFESRTPTIGHYLPANNILIKAGVEELNARQIIETAFNIGLSPKNTVKLFYKIIDKCGDYSSLAFKFLANALSATKEMGLDRNQSFEFMDRIIDKCGKDACWAFEHLPAGYETLREMGLDQTQSFEYLNKIIDKCGKDASWAFRYLPTGYETLREMGLDQTQAIKFMDRIIDKCGNGAGWAFRYLPVGCETLREMGMDQTQSVKYLDRIIDKCGENAYWAFEHLPAGYKP